MEAGEFACDSFRVPHAFDVNKIPTGPAHPLRQYLGRGPPLDSASTPRVKPRSITVLTRFSFRPPANPPPILPRRGCKKKAIVTHELVLCFIHSSFFYLRPNAARFQHAAEKLANSSSTRIAFELLFMTFCAPRTFL